MKSADHDNSQTYTVFSYLAYSVTCAEFKMESPDLNPIEMVWDELDRSVKEKQPTSTQHMWELLQDCWKSIPGEFGRENAKNVQSYHQGKRWLLKNLKYILICLTSLW